MTLIHHKPAKYNHHVYRSYYFAYHSFKEGVGYGVDINPSMMRDAIQLLALLAVQCYYCARMSLEPNDAREARSNALQPPRDLLTVRTLN